MPNQNPCRKAFEVCGDKGQEFQIFLDGRWPGFYCECMSVSANSPSPVSNEEDVVRLIVHPIHFDRGRLTATAFVDLTQHHLSVFRIPTSSRQEVVEEREKIVRRGYDKNPPQTRMADIVCRANVEEIRSVLENGQRCMGVYDTGEKSCIGHASVFVSSDLLDSKPARLKARQIAYQIFSKRIETLESVLMEMAN